MLAAEISRKNPNLCRLVEERKRELFSLPASSICPSSVAVLYSAQRRSHSHVESSATWPRQIALKAARYEGERWKARSDSSGAKASCYEEL